MSEGGAVQEAPDLGGRKRVDIVCFKCRGAGLSFVKSRKRKRGRGGSGAGADEATVVEHNEASAGGAGDEQGRGPPPREGAIPVPGKSRLWQVPCGICGGAGKLVPKRAATKRADSPFAAGTLRHPQLGTVLVRGFKAPQGWAAPGPAPFAELQGLYPVQGPAARSGGGQAGGAAGGEAEAAAGGAGEAGVELCALCGRWRVFQPVRGHRYSTDDVVTAWLAARAFATLASPDGPRAALDMGCGIGSVLLLTAWQWPRARCAGVEAQEERWRLARASAAYNEDPALGRIRVVRGDLREACAALAPDGGFDLVTGTPPYWAAAGAALPPEMGRARCLYEFFGGVEDYCAAAAPLLSAARGLFVVCTAGTAEARAEAGAARAGLCIVARLAVVPKVGKPPLFRVFAMARAGGEAAARATERAAAMAARGERLCPPGAGAGAGTGAGHRERITVRGEGGERTESFRALLRAVGKPA